MPLKRIEWMQRVKAVEREHTATRFATDYLLSAVRQDSGTLQGDLRVRDVERSSEQLDARSRLCRFLSFLPDEW